MLILEPSCNGRRVLAHHNAKTTSLSPQEKLPLPLPGRACAVVLPHGGSVITRPVLPLTPGLLAQIEKTLPWLPEHNRLALDLARHLVEARCHPAYLLCETAFFSSLPPAAQAYALPHEYLERGVRRYGCGGLVHAWAWKQASRFDPAPRTLLSLALDDQPSLALVRRGQALETSSGFTPCDGPLGRFTCGSLDASIPLLLRQQGLQPTEIRALLLQDAGWNTLAGADLRLDELLLHGDPRGVLAQKVLLHSLVKAAGGLFAAAGKVDAVAVVTTLTPARAAFLHQFCQALGFAGVQPEAHLPGEGPAADGKTPVVLLPAGRAALLEDVIRMQNRA